MLRSGADITMQCKVNPNADTALGDQQSNSVIDSFALQGAESDSVFYKSI